MRESRTGTHPHWKARSEHWGQRRVQQGCWSWIMLVAVTCAGRVTRQGGARVGLGSGGDRAVVSRCCCGAETSVGVAWNRREETTIWAESRVEAYLIGQNTEVGELWTQKASDEDLRFWEAGVTTLANTLASESQQPALLMFHCWWQRFLTFTGFINSLVILRDSNQWSIFLSG